MDHRIIFILVQVFAPVLCTRIENNYASPSHSQFLRSRGETVVTRENFPFVAEIVVKDRHICSGTIISEYFILSAAHCTLGLANLVRIPPDVCKIIVGNQYILSEGVDYSIFRILHHEQYIMNINVPQNDISLIQVEVPIQFNPFIKALPLAKRAPLAGAVGWIIGFGGIGSAETPSDGQLSGIQLMVLRNNECRKIVENADPKECAGFVMTAEGPCMIDSGGPFVVNGKLVGIVPIADGCLREALPGMYTSVAHHYQWIQDTVRAANNKGWIKGWNPFRKTRRMYTPFNVQTNIAVVRNKGRAMY